jgi:hypothetical protein
VGNPVIETRASVNKGQRNPARDMEDFVRGRLLAKAARRNRMRERSATPLENYKWRDPQMHKDVRNINQKLASCSYNRVNTLADIPK